DRCRRLGEALPAISGSPDVSIVVPVYNQLPFTLSAIASVYAQRTRYSYEILLADDGSNDQTRTITDGMLPRVRVVRHTKNLGFMANCNAAAQLARGAFIVLLNNDTIALPNWLDELIAPMQADPSVGVVGSKLLYPNGRLQEAG